METNVGRKYKSRKERPCDACRKRKICCTREAFEKDCSLCKTRNEHCKYVLPPNVRRNRQPPSRASVSSTSSTASATANATSREKGVIAKRNIEGSNEWICQFVGLSGDQDPFVLRHCSFNQLNCYKSIDWACLRVRGDGDVPMHFTVVPDSHLDARPDYYPPNDTEALVRPHSNRLLRTYFETVHTSYPLLDPSRFSEKPKNGDPLIAVMYAMASPLCPDVGHNTGLSAFVHQALPIEKRHPRLETIEACLIWLQRHTRIHRSPTTPGLWGEIGGIVGMAQDIGLNVDPSNWNLAPSDYNRRLRLWWGVYIQDKWSALGLGRPSYLSDEHCNVPMITLDHFPHTGPDGASIGTMPAQIFVAMAHLSVILSDILNTFYSLKAMDRAKALPAEMLYAYLDDFQSRLNSFHEVHLTPFYNNNSLLDSTGTVFLAFYTAEIVLYRALLRCLPMTDPSYAGVREQAKSTLTNVVQFLEKLQVNRLRAFWWSPMSRINFAMAGGFMFFLLLTSVEDFDVEFWSSQIEHYRGLLRLQSISFDVTKLASTRMDLLAAGMGVDLPPIISAAEGVGNTGVTNGGKIDLLKLQPDSAESWIARQGHQDMLLAG